MRQKNLRVLVEIALFASIGVVFDMLTFHFMPQGGGISLKMIPILLISIRWGFGAGFLTGMLIGFIDVATGVTFYHWVQVFLDHCLANAVVGVVAIFNKSIHDALRNGRTRAFKASLFVGVLLASFCKFAVHVISGVIFFYMFANGQNIWIYSIVYNATPAIPTTIVCLIFMGILLSSAPKLVVHKLA